MSHSDRERCSKSKRCRLCARARRRQRERQRQKFFARMAWAKNLLGGRCTVPDCENTDLEFDHIDPRTKSGNIPRLWSRTFAVFEAEVRKCQLLCVEHHRHKTSGRDDASFEPVVIPYGDGTDTVRGSDR